LTCFTSPKEKSLFTAESTWPTKCRFIQVAGQSSTQTITTVLPLTPAPAHPSAEQYDVAPEFGAGVEAKLWSISCPAQCWLKWWWWWWWWSWWLIYSMATIRIAMSIAADSRLKDWQLAGSMVSNLFWWLMPHHHNCLIHPTESRQLTNVNYSGQVWKGRDTPQSTIQQVGYHWRRFTSRRDDNMATHDRIRTWIIGIIYLYFMLYLHLVSPSVYWSTGALLDNHSTNRCKDSWW